MKCLNIKLICIIGGVFCLFPSSLFPKNKEALRTIYKKGVFETAASIETFASQDVMSKIFSDIIHHLQKTEIDSLHWATKNLTGDAGGGGKNLIHIEYKGGKYNAKTEILSFWIDIYVSGLKKSNIPIDIILKSGYNASGEPIITAELYQPNLFLKKAKGVLLIQNKEGYSNTFVIKSYVQFNYFFDLFVSKSNYCHIAEWRILQFLNNITTEAENRK